MGFFDFIADAGSSLFKGDEPPEDIANSIIENISSSGVNVDKLTLHFDHGNVVLLGRVPDQDQKEKAVLIAGNIKGVESVKDNLKVGEAPKDPEEDKAELVEAEQESSDEPTFRTYTVKSGDTLGKISKEMYGKSSLYNKIFEANTPMLKTPDLIYPGQVLRIPE